MSNDEIILSRIFNHANNCIRTFAQGPEVEILYFNSHKIAFLSQQQV